MTPSNTLAVVESTGAEPGRDAAREIAQLRNLHWMMLWIAVAILAAAFLLREQTTGRVALAFFPEWNLPTLCGSRVLFNIECPGCGLTRSFIALAAGDLRASLAANRVGWLIALALVLQIPYRWYALSDLRNGVPTRTWPTWCGYLLIAALVVNWLLRVSGIY